MFSNSTSTSTASASQQRSANSPSYHTKRGAESSDKANERAHDSTVLSLGCSSKRLHSLHIDLHVETGLCYYRETGRIIVADQVWLACLPHVAVWQASNHRWHLRRKLALAGINYSLYCLRVEINEDRRDHQVDL